KQVTHRVGATALPGSAWECRRDRVDETGVRVRGDQPDAAEAARDQAAEEGEPAGAVLAGDHVEAERFPEAVLVDANGVDDADVDRAAALAALDLEAVKRHVRVRRRIKRAGAEVLD